MTQLTSGANAPIAGNQVDILIAWPTAAGSLDPSAFLTANSGKVRSDADMVFYNQLSAEGDCVRLTESTRGQACFAVTLSAVPADVARIVFCLTLETPGQAMSAFAGTALTLFEGGAAAHRFAPVLAGATEVSMMVAELYRRQGSWKIRAIGQGFRDGLGALATSLGVDVEGEEGASAPAPVANPAPAAPRASPPAPPPPPPAPVPAAEPPPPPPPPPPLVRTSGSEPFARGATLICPGHGGRVSVTLDWRWTLGGADGRIRPLGLALGAAAIAADGGRLAVQSTDWRGRLESAPWLATAPGNLADENAAQERLTLNLDGVSSYARIDIYAYITEGAATWRGAEAWINVAVPSLPTSEFCIDPPADGMAAIALVRIDNHAGQCAVSRIDIAAADQRELDARLDWQLAWRYPRLV
jgi:tellurite resistance protein TerA